MKSRLTTASLFATLLLALLGGTDAFGELPFTVVYGTTAASSAGQTYTPGSITNDPGVQFDDGTLIANTNDITVGSELRFNQTTGTFTLTNKVLGSGTVSVVNSGTLQLTGTSGSRLLPLNMTVNVSDGGLTGTAVSGTQTAIFQLGSSGTGTLNVSGGIVSGSSWQVGVGSSGVGTVNVTGGTFGPIATLTVGGSSGGSGGRGTLNISNGVVGDNPTTPLNVGGFRFGVGANSFGAATITSGTLRATSIATVDGATGSFIGLSGTGSVTLNSGYLQAAHLTIGSASNGTGTLNIVSGSASFNNTTVGNAGSGTMTLTGGVLKSGNGTLGASNGGTGVVTVTNGTWLVNGNGLSGGERDGVLRVGGTNGGTGSLTISNGGYVVVSGTFARGTNGTFTLGQGGTLQIGGASGSYNVATLSNAGSGTMGILVGDLDFAGTLKFARNGAVAYTNTGVLSGAGNVVKTGTGAVVLSANNSYTGGTTLTAGTLTLGSANAIGTTGTISFGGGALQATTNNTTDYSARFSTDTNQQYAIDSNGEDLTLTSNLTSVGGSFRKVGAGSVTLTGVNTFTSGTVGGGTLIGNAQSLAASGTFGVAANGEVRFQQDTPDSWAGIMVGSGTFVKSGSSRLTLSTASTNGSTNGTLIVSEGLLVGTTGNIKRNVSNNSFVTFDQTTSGTYARIMSGTGGVSLIGSGTVTFTGSNNYSGGTTIAGGRLVGTTTSLQGAITNNSSVQFNQTTTGTYAGDMSGSGLLTKTGVGTVTLTGSNSYQGGTTVAAGSLVGSTSSLQGTFDVQTNGTLSFNQATDGTFSGELRGSGNFIKGGVGSLTLAGTNTNGGTWNVAAGSLVGTTESLRGTITNNAAVTFGQTTSGTYAGNMSGNGTLAKLGSGTVTLSGASSYSGGTIVSAGSLVGTTTSLQGAITNNAAVAFDQSTDGTYAGAMSGNGSLSKLGNGVLTLSGTSSYSGGTALTAGQLVVDGSISSSTVTVDNGAILSGSGSVGGIVINTGGTMNPGNSPGTLNVAGNVTWNVGGNYNWQIYDTSLPAGTGWDLINATGGLDLTSLSSANKFNLNLWSLSGISPDTNGSALNFNNTQNYTWTILTAATGITGFANDKFNINLGATNGTFGFANALGGGTFSLGTSGNNLNLIFTAAGPGPGPSGVPEPGTWAAAALLAGGAAFMRWRKRARAS